MYGAMKQLLPSATNCSFFPASFFLNLEGNIYGGMGRKVKGNQGYLADDSAISVPVGGNRALVLFLNPVRTI
jgi:hypothetical protein